VRFHCIASVQLIQLAEDFLDRSRHFTSRNPEIYR
jgi:hypothetical protein